MGSVVEPSPAVEPTTGDVKHQQPDHPSPAWPENEAEDDAKKLEFDGPPVDEAKTGTWRAAKFLTGLALSDFQATIGLAISLGTFLVLNYSQSVADSSIITSNVIGTAFLLTVLGGFIADSYLGAFYTIVLGGVVMIAGLGMLTLVAGERSLQPPKCTTLLTLGIPCSPAGTKYMAPLYIAIYTVALGSGLVRPNLTALGGEQFDESVPAEKKQLLSFFIWFYFVVSIGILIAFTLGVYIHTSGSNGWGFGFSLMLFSITYAIFLMGTPRIRRKRPSGSFLTRMTQVFVASIRKTWSNSVLDKNDLYDTAPTGRGVAKAVRTNKLRFLDRAAIIEEEDKRALKGGWHHPNPWSLCSVAQVEETKSVLQLVPIWASTSVITLIFSQLSTFTIQQARTMDRKVGGFDIPAASLGTMLVIGTFFIVPFYAFLVRPIATRLTGRSYGLTPIMRMGISLIFAIITMVTAGLVERKRLDYVRGGSFEHWPLGSYNLPITFWWLLPQFLLAAIVEFFFYPSAFEFFFFETSEETHSIGVSFTFSSAAIGLFMSTLTVQIINLVTRHDKGGSWLTEAASPLQPLAGQLNTGGLEKYYYFLACLIFVALVIYSVSAYFYECKHDWYGQGSVAASLEGDHSGGSESLPPQP